MLPRSIVEYLVAAGLVERDELPLDPSEPRNLG